MGERKTEKEREKKTRGPHSWLLYCHEAPTTLLVARLGEGGGQRGSRGGVKGTTGEARVKRRVSGSTTGMVSLEGVVDRRWPTRVAILLSPGCKTYQNPVRPI